MKHLTFQFGAKNRSPVFGMAYRLQYLECRRLRQKGVPFSGFGYIEGWGFHKLRYIEGYGNRSFNYNISNRLP